MAVYCRCIVCKKITGCFGLSKWGVREMTFILCRYCDNNGKCDLQKKEATSTDRNTYSELCGECQ